MAKMIGLSAIDLTISVRDRALRRQAEEDVGAFEARRPACAPSVLTA